MIRRLTWIDGGWAKQICDCWPEAGEERRFQEVGALDNADAGLGLNSDFSVRLIQQPYFLANAAEIITHVSSQIHRCFRWRQNLQDNVRRKRYGGAVRVDPFQSLAKKDREIRTADRVYRDATVVLSDGFSDGVLSKVALE